MENLYSILGVSKDADEKELKKAYRKRSLENHPDRVASKSKEEQEAAAGRMQEINKAYEILSDPQKREVYDMTGSVENAEKGDAGFGSGGFGFSDIFGDIFGGMRPQHGGFGSSRREQQPGTDLQIRLKIGIEELWNPKPHKLKIVRSVRCRVCHGSGGDVKTCPHCHDGYITETRRDGFAVIQQTKPCPYCRGTGKIVTKKCDRCGGTGFEKSEFEKTVMFPEGIQDGQSIVYENEGCESKSPDGRNGRLIVTAKYDFDESVYEVDEADVTENVYVNYEDCILGTTLKHSLPDGKTITLTVPKLTPSGKKFMLKGRGIRIHDAYEREFTGNYYIRVLYGMPSSLSAAEKDCLEKIKSLRNKEK